MSIDRGVRDGSDTSKITNHNGSFACKKAGTNIDAELKKTTPRDEKHQGFPFRASLLKGDNNDLLSLKFMNKPSRSNDLFAQASDPTRANSILNSHISNESTSASEGDTADTSPSNENIEHHGLVRKKSGEFLRLSLKDSRNSYFDKKRSRSLPTTPTYKQVHFGGDNDIRYFKKKDRPTAISASNSPTLRGVEGDFKKLQVGSDDEEDKNDDDDDYEDDYADLDSDRDYFTLDLSSSGSTTFPGANHEKSVSWDLKLPNFPPLSYDNQINYRKSPVFLERIFISIDKKFLLGHIAVKNIAFEKSITVRYTLDNWCTIVEIPTIYVPGIPKILKSNNYDRFIFRIPLDSLFNSFRMPGNKVQNGSKSQEQHYSLCIKYTACSLEFWDNNDSKNYDLVLIKTTKPPRTSLSKIGAHNNRPKYSSSYLKRRSSDSKLEMQPKKPDENIENSSSDFSNSNDFVNNDFYLLSPLLSSLNNSNYENDFLHNYSTDTLTSYRAPSKNFSDCQDEVYDLESNKEDMKSREDDNSFRNNMLDTKSYRELLDTYCFFSSSPDDDTNSTDALLNASSPRNSSSTNSSRNEKPNEPMNVPGSNGHNPTPTSDVSQKGLNSSKEKPKENNNSLTVSSILRA
mmetsp:Transcript_5740/g.5686  ORF Transcript_5740/g.5686 Transcript_5740/m.5686 type:complete len:629 (+) Transcript_5740:71-1957(+)